MSGPTRAGPFELIPRRREAADRVEYTAAVDRPIPLDAAAIATTDQLSTRLGDEVVILGLQDSAYYGLADVGARIWDLLQTRRTLTDILDVVVAEFEVSRERAAADLSALIADLHARGLVAVTFPDPS